MLKTSENNGEYQSMLKTKKGEKCWILSSTGTMLHMNFPISQPNFWSLFLSFVNHHDNAEILQTKFKQSSISEFYYQKLNEVIQGIFVDLVTY